jgi:hypothetical protein
MGYERKNKKNRLASQVVCKTSQAPSILSYVPAGRACRRRSLNLVSRNMNITDSDFTQAFAQKNSRRPRAAKRPPGRFGGRATRPSQLVAPNPMRGSSSLAAGPRSRSASPQVKREHFSHFGRMCAAAITIRAFPDPSPRAGEPEPPRTGSLTLLLECAER